MYLSRKFPTVQMDPLGVVSHNVPVYMNLITTLIYDLTVLAQRQAHVSRKARVLKLFCIRQN